MGKFMILASAAGLVGCATTAEQDLEESVGEVLCRQETVDVSVGEPRPTLFCGEIVCGEIVCGEIVCGEIENWRSAVRGMSCSWLDYNIRYHARSPKSVVSVHLKDEYARRCS